MSKACLKSEYEYCKTEDGFSYRRRIKASDKKDQCKEASSQPISDLLFSSCRKINEANRFEYTNQETEDGLTFRRKIKIGDLEAQSIKNENEAPLSISKSNIEQSLKFKENVQINSNLLSCRKINFNESIGKEEEKTSKIEPVEECLINLKHEEWEKKSEAMNQCEVDNGLSFRRKRKAIDKLESDSKQPILIEKQISLPIKPTENLELPIPRLDTSIRHPKRCPDFPDFSFTIKKNYKIFPSSIRLLYFLEDLIFELKATLKLTYSAHPDFLSVCEFLLNCINKEASILLETFNEQKKKKWNEKTIGEIEERERRRRDEEEWRIFFKKIRKNPINLFLKNEKKMIEIALLKLKQPDKELENAKSLVFDKRHFCDKTRMPMANALASFSSDMRNAMQLNLVKLASYAEIVHAKSQKNGNITVIEDFSIFFPIFYSDSRALVFRFLH
ncbi:unnamed protein product [Blepharisma stoltei]|uniref:Uncharacterized protein n=1 Tax=Blepharisma stoltei TaxID=1481888 RepID=A0AAU9IDM8_9CILI|nr:unnamed protein product [Blepharisma stoltei]